MLKTSAETIAYANFHGSNWSSKVWERQDALREVVRKGVADTILRGKGIQLPQTLSAMARDIYVKTGYLVRGDYKIQPGSKITNVEVIAGKDVRRQIDDIQRLVREHGDNEKDWQKVKGTAMLSDGRKIEAHCYQAKNVGKVEFKVKRWL